MPNANRQVFHSCHGHTKHRICKFDLQRGWVKQIKGTASCEQWQYKLTARSKWPLFCSTPNQHGYASYHVVRTTVEFALCSAPYITWKITLLRFVGIFVLPHGIRIRKRWGKT
jgi:hypothetical protein